MWPRGPTPVCPARRAKSIAMSTCRLPTFLSLLAVLPTSMWIWWVRCPCPLATPTCSQSWTEQLGGQRQFPCPADCAAALLQGWIQRFGVPSTITSDCGPQFTSQLWSALCRLLSIFHIQTTAYHSQANGLVEQLHHRLKDALRGRAASVDLYLHLPWVMLGVRAA